MTPRYRFIFWEPSESPHKHDLFLHLHRHPRVDGVTVVTERLLPGTYRRAGWSVPEATDYPTIVKPSPAAIGEIVADAAPNTIHIFSGVRWVPTLVEGLRRVIAAGARFGVMSEPRTWEGARGWLRYLHSWATERPLRARADFVLAIGRHGPPWFHATGYRRERVFPFAYFIAPPGESPPPPTLGERPRVCFVGRLEKLKGFHHFLDALPHVNHPIAVDIAGSGRLEATALEASAGNPGIRYHGVVPMGRVGELLGRCDIVVAPSTTMDDGWGVVVSEGLLHGAAIVCSDRVGASICVDEPRNGRLIPPGSPTAIARAIDALIDEQAISAEHRIARARWAKRYLTGAAGADCLMGIIAATYEGGERPRWFHTTGEGPPNRTGSDGSGRLAAFHRPRFPEE